MSLKAYSRSSIIQRLFNQPLAVLPDTAAIVLGAIGDRLDVSQMFVAGAGQRLSLAEMQDMAADERARIESRAGTDRLGPKQPAERLMRVIDGVGYIDVRGELVAENGIGPMSGFTGYDGICAQVAAADADRSVKGLLLDIDSPGGEVAGLYECVGQLMARRGIKPMRAMIRGQGTSAAYALAACADDVTLHELGYAGSIGTILMHVDLSAKLGSEGVRVTLVTAGAQKAAGNPFEPLPESVRERFAQLVSSCNDRFIAHVVAARGLKEQAVRDQQAGVFQGQEAVEAGLVDKVMSWADSMEEFTQSVNGGSSRSAAGAPLGAGPAKEKTMDPNANAPAAESQPDTAALEAARAEGHTAGVTAGATTERERILAIVDIDAKSSLSDAARGSIEAGTSAGDHAIALAKANKAAGPAALAAARSDAADPGSLPAANAETAAGQPGQKPVNRGQAYAERKTANAD